MLGIQEVANEAPAGGRDPRLTPSSVFPEGGLHRLRASGRPHARASRTRRASCPLPAPMPGPAARQAEPHLAFFGRLPAAQTRRRALGGGGGSGSRRRPGSARGHHDGKVTAPSAPSTEGVCLGGTDPCPAPLPGPPLARPPSCWVSRPVPASSFAATWVAEPGRSGLPLPPADADVGQQGYSCPPHRLPPRDGHHYPLTKGKPELKGAPGLATGLTQLKGKAPPPSLGLHWLP